MKILVIFFSKISFYTLDGAALKTSLFRFERFAATSNGQFWKHVILILKFLLQKTKNQTKLKIFFNRLTLFLYIFFFCSTICFSICLSITLASLSVYLFVCCLCWFLGLSVCLFISWTAFKSINLFVHLSLCRFVYLPVYLSMYLSVVYLSSHKYIGLSINRSSLCLPIHLSFSSSVSLFVCPYLSALKITRNETWYQHYDTQHNDRILLCWVSVTPSVAYLPFLSSLIMLNVILNFIMLNVIALNVIMLNVIILNVIMLSVIINTWVIFELTQQWTWSNGIWWIDYLLKKPSMFFYDNLKFIF